MNTDAASKLPANIKFGTSTWTYPGWQGLIYHKTYKSDKEFRAESLAEYCEFPWFRAVGIDWTFYTPPKKDALLKYIEMVPEDFQWTMKVWERITTPKFPSHKRYGTDAGKDNPDFLNPQLMTEQFLRNLTDPKIIRHTGLLAFQFPSIAKSVMQPEEFFERLARFLKELPTDFKYAIEVRNRDYLCKDYFDIINEAGATHCFNHWSYMPSLRAQMTTAAEHGSIKSDMLFARLLTPRGISYADAVKRFQPYDQLKEPQLEARQDMITFIKRALQRNVTAFVIVNNRFEGNSPMTIDALGNLIVEHANN